MAETITCRLINGSSFPLNEQMSNNFCRRQTDTCVRHAVRVCVCVWFGLRPSANWTMKNYFVRSNMLHISVMMPVVPPLYPFNSTPTIERHEYTCNLLICLICPKIRWGWLSHKVARYSWIHAECGSVSIVLNVCDATIYSMILTQIATTKIGRCVHVSCAWLAGWLVA